MPRKWWFKIFIFLLILGTSGVVSLPSLISKTPAWFPSKSKINLGLDLQGGLYIVLGVDFDKVFYDEVQNIVLRTLDFLQGDEINGKITTKNRDQKFDPRLTVDFEAPEVLAAAKKRIKKDFLSQIRITGETETTLELALASIYKKSIEQNAVSKSIEVIRNRIDEFGVTEPEIVSQGKDRIVLQLPGIKDIQRAKELIGKTAKLEFKIVNDEVTGSEIMLWIEELKKKNITYAKGQKFSEFLAQVNETLKDKLPKEHQLLFQRGPNAYSYEQMMPYVVAERADISGDDLRDAYPSFDQNNTPEVALTFNGSGTKKFAEVTSENVNKRLAIILDGNVYMAPSINTPITTGSARITLGGGNYQEKSKEAHDMALVLRAGALPVELDFEEQRVIGPSLGRDSIKLIRTAGMIGIACVFLFIIFFYKVPGLIAVLTLFVNILIVFSVLIGLDATLTLPGMAGLALTVGMAVDANIIIYERIKEELLKGTQAMRAVQEGFARAFWTILDANITTALAGVALVNFGTGPIRGFAVTLLIGIFTTVYTSYFLSRTLFQLYLKLNKENIKI